MAHPFTLVLASTEPATHMLPYGVAQIPAFVFLAYHHLSFSFTYIFLLPLPT